MSTINLQLPESLHQSAQALAEKEKITLDHLITLALAEKMSALLTEELLTKRAQLGDAAKFRAALNKVEDVEPEPHDRL